MTGDDTQPDHHAHPAVRELRDLIDSGGWRHLPALPDMLLFIHPWPDGSVDMLAVTGETDACVERTNPAGDPVWSPPGGDLRDMIALLRELPPPDATNAPRLVVPSSNAISALWTPRRNTGGGLA